jgi:chromosome segregation ATPase
MVDFERPHADQPSSLCPVNTDQTGPTNSDDQNIAELEAMAGERDRVAVLLTEAEQRLARIPELEVRIADLEHELAHARAETAAARQEAKELDQMLMYGRRMLRYVRPMIKPLRDARRRLRR